MTPSTTLFNIFHDLPFVCLSPFFPSSTFFSFSVLLSVSFCTFFPFTLDLYLSPSVYLSSSPTCRLIPVSASGIRITPNSIHTFLNESCLLPLLPVGRSQINYCLVLRPNRCSAAPIIHLPLSLPPDVVAAVSSSNSRPCPHACRFFLFIFVMFCVMLCAACILLLLRVHTYHTNR